MYIVLGILYIRLFSKSHYFPCFHTKYCVHFQSLVSLLCNIFKGILRVNTVSLLKMDFDEAAWVLSWFCIVFCVPLLLVPSCTQFLCLWSTSTSHGVESKYISFCIVLLLFKRESAVVPPDSPSTWPVFSLKCVCFKDCIFHALEAHFCNFEL